MNREEILEGRKIIGITTPSESEPATITEESMTVLADFTLDANISLGTFVVIGLFSTDEKGFFIKHKVAAQISEHGLQPPPGIKSPLFAGYRDLKPLTRNWAIHIQRIIPELFQTCRLKLLGIIDEKTNSLKPLLNPIPYGCPIVLPTRQEMKIIYAFKEGGWPIGAIVQGMEVVKFKENGEEKVLSYPLDPYTVFRSMYIVGGPGSGKTVFAKSLIEWAYLDNWVINAPDFKDEIAQMIFESDPKKLGFTEEDIELWEKLGLSPMRIENCSIYYIPAYAPNFAYLKQEGYDISEIRKHMVPFTISWENVSPDIAALYMPNPSEQAVDFFPQVMEAFRQWAEDKGVRATLRLMRYWAQSKEGQKIMEDLGLYSSTVQSIQRNLIAMERSKLFDVKEANDFKAEFVMKPPRLNVISVSRVPFEFQMIFQLHWLLKSLEYKRDHPGKPYLMQILDEAHYIVPRRPRPGYQTLLVSKVIEAMRVFRAAGSGIVLISHSPYDFNEIVDSMVGTKIFGNLEERAIERQARDLQEFASRISKLPPGYFVIRSPSNITNIAAPKCHLIKAPRCRTMHIESEVLYRRGLIGEV